MSFTLSIIIPLYNEADNIPTLTARLDALIGGLDAAVEILLVDDHSSDATPSLLRDLCAHDARYRYLRLAANRGSHVAIAAGLAYARGDCAVFLAGDLQDPPELIPDLVARWRAGDHIVWAVRAERKGLSLFDKMTSRLFYAVLNRFSTAQLPPTGADFALLDRKVIDQLLRAAGPNFSLGMEIARLGYRQAQIPYVKAARLHGESKWNLERKLRAFADAFISTSYVPLRLMSYLGLAVSFSGFLYALLVVVIRIATPNYPVEGWAALMVVVLVFGGLQMLMLGVIGEYLWRTLEQARKRPLFWLEDSVNLLEAEREDLAPRPLQPND